MRASLSPARRVVLAIGMVPVAAACVGGAVLVTGAVQGGRSYVYSTVQAAPTELEVVPSDTGVTLEPSLDGQVHVAARGHYAGRRPQVGLALRDGRLTITATCHSTWLHSCRLDLDVALPAHIPVVARGDNGAIRARGLSGALQLQTSNGAITADTISGSTVSARTDNGDVSLDFAAPPTTVDAQTSNGHIDIGVPTSAAYYLTTRTENGGVDTSVPSDRFAQRTITARTDNGDIHVHPR
jgi:hypothetical protein